MLSIRETYAALKNRINSGDVRSQKLKRNSIGVLFIKYSSILIELIKVPILLSYLDNERYGVWLTIVSMVMWTHQFDFGLGAGLRYKLTEAITSKDEVRCRQLVSTAYFSMSVIMLSVFFLLAICLYSLNWNNILNAHSISNTELYASVVAVLALFLLRFVLELICIVLRADQRTATSTIFLPIGTIASLIGVYALQHIHPNSLFLASILMILPYVVILVGANLYYFSKDYAKYSPNLHFFHKSSIGDIYSMGLKYFVGQLASLVVFSSSNILIAHLMSPSDVAVYNTARQYYYLPITFVSIMLLSFAPPVTEAYIKGDFGWIERIMARFRILGHFSVIVAIAMFVISGFSFNIWTHGRIEVPLSLSVAFCFYVAANVYNMHYVEFLAGAGKMEIRMWLGIFKIITFIPVAVAFMHEWGLMGLMIAILLINILPNWLFSYIQYKKLITGTATGIWNK